MDFRGAEMQAKEAEDRLAEKNAEIATLQAKLDDKEGLLTAWGEWRDDTDRLIRQIDAIISGGEEHAAKQASLCDLVGLIEDMTQDAERWRALMKSPRMHFMGSAGFDKEGAARPGENLHFGIEFWNKFAYPPNSSDSHARKVLLNYAEAMRASA